MPSRDLVVVGYDPTQLTFLVHFFFALSGMLGRSRH